MRIKKSITEEQRTKASTDLTVHYLSAIGYDWRLIKVQSIAKLLKEKYIFFKDLIPGTEAQIEAKIAQEVTIGLICDAISEAVQYIEDLFALIRASENPDYFIKNIITYQAGQITNKIKTFIPNKSNLEKAFHLPIDINFPEDADNALYSKGLSELEELCKDFLKFYNDYEYFYLQYKHGLTIPFRPFGNSYSEEQVEQDKQGMLVPFLAAYDNFNLKAASQRGTFNTNQGVFMPGFSDNVRAIIPFLHDENNYLRYVVSTPKNRTV